MIRTKAPIDDLARRVFSHGFRRFGRVFFFIFCRVHIIHIGRLPQDRAMILASNHISHFDPLLLGTFFARYVDWMATEELFSHPLAASIVDWLCFHLSPADLPSSPQARKREDYLPAVSPPLRQRPTENRRLF